ncbi:MAG: porin PorA family protein [Aeromicrobium sp.]|uniref:porin PorA family protein n=1 Tax=Aeromicrobium sp. TaxID=1871063 RepID=UPI00262E845D|nr:porin PorA family protein [Aeromicrobium sp.]MDF1705757.1 porin PorA family protein [Aeromicrobium sp.]
MAKRHTDSSTARAGRGTAFTISGLLLVALAALTVFVIAPKLTQLPGDFSSTVTYDGESAQLDPATLKLDEPTSVDATREVEVTETDGSTATIRSISTANLPTGASVTDKTFAINRTDYQQVEGVDGVDDQKGGMVLSHVRHPNKEPFTVYDATTDAAQKVEFVREETIKGRQAYYFEGTSILPVKAEGTLETLQASVGQSMGTDGTVLPNATVASFVSLLDGANGQALRDAVAQAGPEIPATYISTNTTQIWIDAELGSPLKTGQDQTISLYADFGAEPYPLLELNSLQLMADDASVTRLVDTAASNASKITLVQSYVPIGLAVLGVILLGVGAVAARPTRTTSTVVEDRELVGSGR